MTKQVKSICDHCGGDADHPMERATAAEAEVVTVIYKGMAYDFCNLDHFSAWLKEHPRDLQ